MVFDLAKQYTINPSADKKNIEIISCQWVNAGTGFSLVVAKDNPGIAEDSLTAHRLVAATNEQE